MSEQPKVSVIVPMYNPGSEILRGLNSLRRQSLEEIEIILVNDGSNADTLTEVRTTALKDDRIRVLDLEANTGPGIARNTGIENAAGEYLAFMDADDYITPDFLELLYRKACLYQADIAKGTLKIEYENGNSSVLQVSQSDNKKIRNGIIDGKPLYALFRSNHSSAIYRHAWILQNDIRYGTSRYGEDSTFLLKAALCAERFITEDDAVYHVIDHPDSLMKQMTASRYEAHIASLTEQRIILERYVGKNTDFDYENHRIRWLLGIQAAAARMGALKKETGAFLEGIRDEVLLLPNVSELAIRSPLIGALIEYHSNVCSIVIREAERKNEDGAIIESIVRCFRFASEHPDRQDLYEDPLKESLDRCIAYYLGLGPYRSRHFRNRKQHAFLKRLHHELQETVDPAFSRRFFRKYFAPTSLLQEAKRVLRNGY